MDAIKKWLPDRKWLFGGIAGILTFYGTTATCELMTWCFDDGTRTEIASVVAFGIAYLTPPSVQDIIKRIDDKIKKLAGLTSAPTP